MGKGVSRRIVNTTSESGVIANGVVRISSRSNMADAIADVSKDRVRDYQTRLDRIAEDADVPGASAITYEYDVRGSLNTLAREVRADQELSEEDRKMMNQRIRRMRERYL